MAKSLNNKQNKARKKGGQARQKRQPSKKKIDDVIKAVEKIELEDLGTRWVIDKIREITVKGKKVRIGKPEHQQCSCEYCETSLEVLALRERKFPKDKYPPGPEKVTTIIRRLRMDRKLKTTNEKDEYGIPELFDNKITFVDDTTLYFRNARIGKIKKEIEKHMKELTCIDDEGQLFDRKNFWQYVRVGRLLEEATWQIHDKLGVIHANDFVESFADTQLKKLKKIKKEQENRKFRKGKHQDETDFAHIIDAIKTKLDSPSIISPKTTKEERVKFVKAESTIQDILD